MKSALDWFRFKTVLGGGSEASYRIAHSCHPTQLRVWGTILGAPHMIDNQSMNKYPPTLTKKHPILAVKAPILRLKVSSGRWEFGRAPKWGLLGLGRLEGFRAAPRVEGLRVLGFRGFGCKVSVLGFRGYNTVR